MVKLDGPNIIQVAMQGKQASSFFVVPNLNFVVIPTRNKQGLGRMEVHTSDGSCGCEMTVIFWELNTVMFAKTIYQGSKSVVPQLDDTIVQRS